MQKKWLNNFPDWESYLKLWQIMKWTLVILIGSVMTVLGNESYSQETRLDINLSNTTIKGLFGYIEQNSEFIFLYRSEDLNVNKKVNIGVKGAKINQILDLALQGENVAYDIYERQIVIRRAGDKPVTVQQPPKKIISGMVKDSKGLTLPGVTVLVKGTTIGTISDAGGQFRIAIPADAKTLMFSFVGMKSQEISIGDKSTFAIVMEDMLAELEDVVVVGYGVQKKESVVGAISQVNSEMLMRGNNINVSNALSGKLSGVETIQTTGEPGDDESEIIIRGLSSWNGSAPLVLVDGVERDFNGLDPNEVNTISVLKDASATAVFGAKGANGVIVITTKRGVLGKPKLEFSAFYGIQHAARTPEFVDSYTTLNMLNVANMNEQLFQDMIPSNILNEYRNPSTPLNALRYPSVDWYSELSNSFASTANANMTVQGGTNFVKYFTSVGYSYQGDFFSGSKNGFLDTRYTFNRVNYRSNLDFTLTKSTHLSFTIGGDIGIKNEPGGAPWKDLFQSSPARYPLYFPAWVLKEVPDPDYPDASGIRLAGPVEESGANPYSDMHMGYFKKKTGAKVFTDIGLNQKLDWFLNGLSLKGKVSLSTYYNITSLTANWATPQYLLNYDQIGIPGVNPWFRLGEGNEMYQRPLLNVNVGGLNDGYYSDLYYEMSLNYSNTFGKHNFTGLALFNRQEKDLSTEFPYYNEALVGRATYDYSHKYLAEMNIGYTGSERFAPANRFGLFPSVALGWVISEEPFFKNIFPQVNKFKLRYSDGLVGSDYATSRWLYINDYWVDNGGYIHESSAANKNAQWEQARKRDLGFEIGLFRDLFSVGVDLFDEYRDKMLLTPRSVTFLVGNSFKELNLGKLKKHGIEVEAGFNKVTGSGFNYYIKGIFGFNENRVIFKDDPIYTPDYIKIAGKPLGAQIQGVTTTGSGYYTSVNDIHNNPSANGLTTLQIGDYKFLDYNADGRITTLDQFPIKGNTYAPITYSLSSGFSYKGFSFNFMFQGDKDKYVAFDNAFENEFNNGRWLVHKSQLNYWTPDNPNATHATLHYSISSPIQYNWGSFYLNDRSWRDASYLRLKDLYFGYTFNSINLKPLKGNAKLTIYVQGNNLWTITPLIDGDPETKAYQIGNSFYPQMSSLKLGMKLGF